MTLSPCRNIHIGVLPDQKSNPSEPPQDCYQLWWRVTVCLWGILTMLETWQILTRQLTSLHDSLQAILTEARHPGKINEIPVRVRWLLALEGERICGRQSKSGSSCTVSCRTYFPKICTMLLHLGRIGCQVCIFSSIALDVNGIGHFTNSRVPIVCREK